MSVSSQDPVPKKVLIIGAGIGGLTTALACLHHGHQVTVLEQAAALGDVGAGIQLPPNAMKVFKALGLEQEIAAHGFAPLALEARMGKTGLRLFHVDVKENAIPQWGAPYLQIHRADYIAVLAKALKARAPEALVLDAGLVDIKQNDKQVQAILADGRVVTGDVLIGADGLHSLVRRHLHGADHAVFTGNVAWRATIPVEKLGDRAPDPTACVWMGRGRHCVTYRLRGGDDVNFVGVVEHNNWPRDFRTASLHTESWSRVGDKSEALEDFAGWHNTITHLIEHMETPHQWALFDRQPLKRWAKGRVALLGDAAHPMLPFMAQGAAMAVEDAWVLAQTLIGSGPRSDDIYVALMRYQRARHQRTSLVQARSRKNAETFHQGNFFGQFKTYAPMWLGGHFAPKVVRSQLDWLYGYDVTRIG